MYTILDGLCSLNSPCVCVFVLDEKKMTKKYFKNRLNYVQNTKTILSCIIGLGIDTENALLKMCINV